MQVDYTVGDKAASIRCPTLVTEGEGDFASQSCISTDALSAAGKPERNVADPSR